MKSVPLEPLEICRRQRIPLDQVALRLRVTPDWLRRLARNPKHTRRIRVAELEAALEQERLALSLQSLLPEGHL
jgi:hypothetical protein